LPLFILEIFVLKRRLMAKIIRNPNPKNVLEEIFFNIECDCGSDDNYPCEPDGSQLELGLLWLVRCNVCGRIWELVYPEDIEHGQTQVRAFDPMSLNDL
jgi:hypothetical protein